MKKLIFIFWFSLVGINSAFPQTTVYHPFPESGAYWRESSQGYQCCCSDYQYVLQGDTVIGAYTYSKVEHSGVMYANNPGGWCITGGYSTFFANYTGAIRNDSNTRKVFFVPSGEIAEQLLYDFNLKLHDTLSASYLYNPGWYGQDNFIRIESIDSVLVGAIYHMRFGLAIMYNLQDVYAYLIEGVGSSSGLFGSLFSLWPPFEFGSMLECFSVNGQPALTGDPTSCLLVTSIAKANPSEPYSLFPNPISEKASIRLPANTMQLDLLVTDMSGRIVLWLKDIRNGCMISREGLSKGMYVYRFISSGIPVSTGKLVVN